MLEVFSEIVKPRGVGYQRICWQVNFMDLAKSD